MTMPWGQNSPDTVRGSPNLVLIPRAFAFNNVGTITAIFWLVGLLVEISRLAVEISHFLFINLQHKKCGLCGFL